MIVIGLMGGFSSFTIDVKTCELMFDINARVKIIFGKTVLEKDMKKSKYVRIMIENISLRKLDIIV